MSQYSELMGSFIRTGNYPLEANYIFSTVESLKEFYSDELNATILHKGLLKIVEDDGEGKQGLFWVTKKEDSDELEFNKLISADDTDSLFEELKNLQEKLDQEIKLRKKADELIWGTDTPGIIPEDLNSILDLANAVTLLREYYDTLKAELKATVGTEEDDIRGYLENLPYKSLTEVSEALNKFLNTYDEEDPQINTLPELQSFLEGYTDSDVLKDILLKLYDDIMGDPYPSKEFRTLRGIEDFVRIFKAESENTDANLQTELNQTQLGVGLDSDGKFSPDTETYYLKDATSVMNALRILDSLINEAINNVNILEGETKSAKINIVKEKDKTTIYANVKLANDSDIQLKNDGLYHKVDTEYEDGILTVRVNGEVRQQHVLGLSMIVESAKYDPSQEAIVLVFKLQSGETQEVVIPAGALISEWEVDNSIPNKVVELNKERIIGSGADKLSADVRLSTNKNNILEKDGNSLLVRGTADNIVFEGDLSVEKKIQLIESENTKQLESIEDLQTLITEEVTRATTEEHLLLDSINEEKNRALSAEQRLDNIIIRELDRASNAELRLEDKINQLEESVGDNISSLIDDINSRLNLEITRSVARDNELAQDIANANHAILDETTRATAREDLLENNITTNSNKLSELETYTKAELAKKLESVQLVKNDDLNYTILVDGTNIGVINIPKDKYLESVTLNGNVLHFVFVTSDGYSTTYIDLTEVLNNALNNTIEDVTNIKTLLNLTVLNLNDEIIRATHQEDLLEKSLNDVLNQANTNTSNINKINDTISEIKLKDVELDSKLSQLDEKITSVETNINNNVNSQLSNLSDKLDSEINRSTEKDSEHTNLINNLNSDLASEVSRATAQEGILKNSIDTNNQILTEKTSTLENNLNTLKTEVNDSLAKKIEKIELLNPTELTYSIFVDGSSIGTIKIPEDQYFIGAELVGNVIRLTYKLNSEFVVKDIDLSNILRDSISGAVGDISNLLSKLESLSETIQAEIIRATNKEIELENTILREIDRAKDEEQDILDEVHHLTDRFEQHTNDFDNPHRVTKEQVGLGNVDNTADADKPISSAVQDALNKKADIIHFHTKADITDLEDMPIIANGFVTLLTELPTNPARGDKYVLRTFTGSNKYAYELLEWDADAENWKQKLITTGGLTCIIDENVWKLNSTGPERILDASDYKYFYNKIYDETKDLIEDIDWEEDDSKNETNGQIRLKITYKTKYGDPDPESLIEHEVTNPYKAKAVKYIDIDKARFLSSAYSRPATQDDINRGYAATLGEPMLILVFTTGDYVAIRLNELMNIYDPVDTPSIDMEVTDWTGNKDKSYKIQADVKIAATKGQDNAISIHINSTNGDQGVYATLHTLTTNSITLNPSTGTSGQKYLTADLKIDNAKNNVNDVLLSISSSGLSAQIIVGEYD